jgi:acyl-CoA synthetase (AMP-forming)/AMP-acid ligase II
LYVVDEVGERLPFNSIGELVVRGSHVMRGYWELPDESAQRFRPGPFPGEHVLYTGDLCRIDEEGFLYFVCRKDEIIKSRGEKVSPTEIENTVSALDGVLEVAVLGVPDPVLGDAIAIFVAPRQGVTLADRDIRAYCARHLEDYMQPKHIFIMSGLKKGATGKIDKRGLMACVASPAD